jgi:hypothetical protein
MKKLHVFATVDELHLPRLKPNAPGKVAFRGSPTVYKSKIASAPLTVKRERRSEADLGLATSAKSRSKSSPKAVLPIRRCSAARRAQHSNDRYA